MAPKKKGRKRSAATSATNGHGGAKKQKPENRPVVSCSDSDEPGKPTSSASITHEDIDTLLEPCSKDQLITFLCDAAVSDIHLLSKIREIADKDISHRKVFVHGLGWDVTKEDLVSNFSPFGAIAECNVVVDKATGRTKGYGFVVFETRAGATKALKQPQKKIKNRVASCQLASIGPTAAGGGSDLAVRKIYVSNVHADVAPDKLREFFAKFGEIETGPLGYDVTTGKSRGFALFVYKTAEGARKALEDPYKMFEGHQLHCQKAAESNKGKGSAGVIGPVTITFPGPAVSAGAGVLGAAGASSQPVLAAVAAAQNLALMGQNPAYGAFLSQNPLMAAALSQTALAQAGINPAAAGLNPAALNSAGLNPYGVNTSLLAAYGTQNTLGLQGVPYGGQSSIGGSNGSYGGMRPYF